MGTKKAKIKLRAFQIKQKVGLNIHSCEIVHDFKEKYNNTKVKDRMRKINSNDDDMEYELIPFLKIDNNTIFGSLLRVEENSLSSKIPDNLLQKTEFKFDDMPTDNHMSTVYKKHFYFCFNNTKVITNLPCNTTITGLQTYINWFLGLSTEFYELTPLCKACGDTSLADVREIVFEDDSILSPLNEPSITTIEDKKDKLIDIGLKELKNLFNSTINLPEEELKNVVSARLCLTLKKPRKMTREEFQNKFGAILKPVADLDNVHYVLKNNQRITAAQLTVIKDIEIEKTAKNFLDEEQLRQSMISFLHEE